MFTYMYLPGIKMFGVYHDTDCGTTLVKTFKTESAAKRYCDKRNF